MLIVHLETSWLIIIFMHKLSTECSFAYTSETDLQKKILFSRNLQGVFMYWLTNNTFNLLQVPLFDLVLFFLLAVS